MDVCKGFRRILGAILSVKINKFVKLFYLDIFLLDFAFAALMCFAICALDDFSADSWFEWHVSFSLTIFAWTQANYVFDWELLI